MVDFDEQGIKTWGERLLFEILGESDIDALVGLATSYNVGCDGDGESNQKRGNTSSKPALGNEGCDQNSDDEHENEQRPSSIDATTTDDEPFYHDPKRFNPLLSASYDSPLPPSYINYIKSRAALLQQDRHRRRRRHSRRGTNRTTNEKTDTTLRNSAAVATGMYLEEALTAALLPLAGLHVLRCRALEAMESAETEFGTMPIASIHNNNGDDNNNDDMAFALRPTAIHPITGEQVILDLKNRIRWKEENAFEEWTLPPEEAILKLVEQGMLSKETPYQFVPEASRSRACAPRTSIVEGANHDDSDIDIEEDRIAVLAKRFDMDPGVVSANKEIFDIFAAKVRGRET
mmetsp:Transcript_18625/g.38840  ORF Transcript_18625/g.38840 Transcript_18625/m.38840 type:complete len:347 (+) Transcript_18625:405-1445(+)